MASASLSSASKACASAIEFGIRIVLPLLDFIEVSSIAPGPVQ